MISEGLTFTQIRRTERKTELLKWKGINGEQEHAAREKVFLSRPVAIAAISRWWISDDLSAL